MNPQNLLTRTSEDYGKMLNHMHWLLTHATAPVWHRACLGRRPSIVGNYLLGSVFERAWAFIFTGQADPADVAAPIA
jgi:hypothetical protein